MSSQSSLAARPMLLWTLKLAVSVGLLALLLRAVPVSEIVRPLERIDWRWLVVALVVGLPVRLLSAWQQQVLAVRAGAALTVRTIFAITLISQFYNLFLPGYASTAIRWHRMARAAKKPPETLAALAVNRVLGTALTVLIGLSFWMVARPPGTEATGLVAAAAAVIVFLVVQQLLFNQTWTERRATSIDQGGSGRVRATAARLLRSAGALGRLPLTTLFGLLCLQLAMHLFGTIGFVGFCRSVDISISFAAAGWIRIAVLLAMSIPITIAGLGLREGAVAALLPLYGVAPATALAMSGLMFFREVAWSLIGGVLEGLRTLAPASWSGWWQESPDDLGGMASIPTDEITHRSVPRIAP